MLSSHFECVSCLLFSLDSLARCNGIYIILIIQLHFFKDSIICTQLDISTDVRRLVCTFYLIFTIARMNIIDYLLSHVPSDYDYFGENQQMFQ